MVQINKMFSRLSLLAILVVCCSAFRLDLDFMTSDDLERYFSVRSLEEVPEYEIVDPLAYSAGGRHRRSIEFGESTKEIKLSAFGEELHMKLDENTQLLADGLQVDVHNEDGTVDKIPLTTTRCFYHGQLMSHENSKVAVSTCDGLTGMIATETHDLLIRPLTEEHKEKYRRRRRDVENPHVIYRRQTGQQANVAPQSAFCALDPEEYPQASFMLHEDMATMSQMQAAFERAPQEYIPQHIQEFDEESNMTEYGYDMYGDDSNMTAYDDSNTTTYEYYGEDIDDEGYNDEETTTESPALNVTEATDEDEDDDKGRRGGGGGHGHGSSGGKGRASSGGGDSDGGSSRKKRQTNGLYLEVRVLADVDMVNYHGQSGVVPYVLTLMNIVAARYMESSLGRTIIIHIVKLGYLNSDSTSERTANGQSVTLNVYKNGIQSLNSWSNFQYYTNPYADSDSGHWDNAVLITRKNLEINGGNSLLGIAWGNATCYLPRQASVNQDQGLSSGIVISHEIGHTLGLRHDSDNGCTNGINVMSSHRPNGAGSFIWSSCSRSDLNTFLSDPYKRCLNDKPIGVSQHPLDAQDRPGSAKSADEQCRLQSTDVQTYVGSCTSNLANICSNLFCRSSSGYCSGIVAAAEGTECGTGRWCVSGRCVTRTSSTSEWRVTDGQCSVTCGNGVSTQVVRCFSPSQNTYVNDQQCNSATRPTSTQIPCTGPTCPITFTWVVQGGSCSVTCGTGVMTQIISCYSQTSSNFVDDVFCDQASRPTPVSQTCFIATCPTATNNWSTVPGQCSKTCGIGTRTDVVSCLSPSGQTLPDNQCNLAFKPTPTTSACFEAECPALPTAFWTVFAFGPCSVTCGTGTQTRNVWCVVPVETSTDLTKVPDDECDQLTKPPTTQSCSSPNTCPDNVWVTTSFSQCSVTCGDGRRTRSVTCRTSLTSTTILNDSQCQRRKPETSESCNIQDCPNDDVIRYKWYSSEEFGECSVTCGSGTQSTLLLCVDLLQFTTVGISSCDVNTRPQQSTRECQASVPCTGTFSGTWQAGVFSSCSATCGSGSQQRLVQCISTTYAYAQLSESDCDPSTKPETTRACNAGTCPDNGEWATRDLSSCSVTCGNGFQTRTVYCRSTTTLSDISESACDANTKPSATQTCHNEQCQSGQWAYTSWSGCTVSCGEGSQSRQVYCYSPATNTVLDNSQCNPSDKPPTSRTCNSGACPNNGPDQGVYCAGLWTRSGFNLNRISSSTNGAFCKESIVAQPGQRIEITFNQCYIIGGQGDRAYVRDAQEQLTISCTSHIDESTGQSYVWTSTTHVVQLEHIGAANHGYDVTVRFVGQPANNGCDRVLTAESGTVTSPNYPSFYPRNLRCQTAIIAPPNKRVQLTYGDIRLYQSVFEAVRNTCSDRLDVYDIDSGDGIANCGSPGRLGQPAHDNRVLIQFISNNDNYSSSGFSISYTFVDA